MDRERETAAAEILEASARDRNNEREGRPSGDLEEGQGNSEYTTDDEANYTTDSDGEASESSGFSDSDSEPETETKDVESNLRKRAKTDE